MHVVAVLDILPVQCLALYITVTDKSESESIICVY